MASPAKPKPLLFAFALSRRRDGRIESWLEDNAVAAIVAPSLSDAKQGIMKQLRANLDFPVHFEDVRGLRAHLHNSVTGAIVGVLSGFDLERVSDSGGVAVKHHGADVPGA
jgi:hypothetical protein